MSDINIIVNLIGGMAVEDIETISAMFMYQGFSPEMVFAHLAKIKKDKNIANDEFITDIKTIVVIGAIMGNYNSNNSNKISDEGKAKGDALISKYELKAGGVGQEKKAVNIPRILAAFPIITTKVLSKCTGRNYGDVFGCNALPNFLKNPVFPSLVPTTLPKKVVIMLLTISVCYTTEQTMAIRKVEDVITAYNQQKQYVDISFRSSVPSQEERSTFIKTLPFPHTILATILTRFNEVTKKTVGMPSKKEMTDAGLVLQ
jgi:hypothetical protein